MSDYHTPVLLKEAVDYLNVLPGRKYVDATLGGGGHALEIKLRGGMVLGIDQDQEAVNYSKKYVDCAVMSNFAHLEEIVEANNWYPVSGVLMDLGISMHQMTTPERGFSYQADGPLDMRMGDTAVIAAELVNQLTIRQLTSLLRDYGEIPSAKILAKKIVSSRPLTTTGQLVNICGKWSQQVFQALRITVNDELGVLIQTIPQVKNILNSGGRAVFICFHSLEDRIIKNQFKTWGQALTKKPILGERGSKLRAYQKI